MNPWPLHKKTLKRQPSTQKFGYKKSDLTLPASRFEWNVGFSNTNAWQCMRTIGTPENETIHFVQGQTINALKHVNMKLIPMILI